MGKTKTTFAVIGGILALAILIFAIGMAELGWKSFFSPKHQNIEREVFENTKSYVHGKIQDLAKLKAEYDRADGAERDVIRNVIITQFANFDADKIDAAGLRNFLVKVRGY